MNQHILVIISLTNDGMWSHGGGGCGWDHARSEVHTNNKKKGSAKILKEKKNERLF